MSTDMTRTQAAEHLARLSQDYSRMRGSVYALALRMGADALLAVQRLTERVAELERERAHVDAAFDQASTIAERDHPDAVQRAWELIAGTLAGPGAPAQPRTDGGDADG